MKTLYGSAMAPPSDERETIDVPLVGEENRSEANHVPRSILVSIIRPRIEEIFELIRSRLEASGFDRVAGRRLVLTGRPRPLQRVPALARQAPDTPVRQVRPLRLRAPADGRGE